MNAIFGREVALCQSICGAIHGGLVDRHPDLKLVYHHLGGNIAGMLGRVRLHQVPEWWGNQDALKPTDAFRDALETNIYLDTSGYLGAVPPLRTALEEFPSSQILLGTDCPFEARTTDDMERFPRVIDDLSSNTDTRQILGENALSILANTE
jgi:predicted TIM-barrel fold metal-dependent hydrolase